MTPNESIIIERTLNGFIVRPAIERNKVAEVAEFAKFAVFQDLGIAVMARDNQNPEDTLVGFIADHFSTPHQE
jgi:hypothetical protein